MIDHELMSRRQPGPRRQTVPARLESGWFEPYLSGSNVLDIGNPDIRPIVPHANDDGRVRR